MIQTSESNEGCDGRPEYEYEYERQRSLVIGEALSTHLKRSSPPIRQKQTDAVL